MRIIIHIICAISAAILLFLPGSWKDMSESQRSAGFWATGCLAVCTYVLRIFDWADAKEKKPAEHDDNL